MEKPFTSDEVKKQNKKVKFNVYEYFSTMVENNTTMLQVETNVLFRNMDAQLDIS
jgi:hypothetical protein